MTLPPQPPTVTVGTLREGVSGWAVAALQAALNRFANSLTEDGEFGSETTRVVRAWQTHHGLTPIDGIAGGMTQEAICEVFDRAASKRHLLPVGLLRGSMAGESGFLLGAVNASTPGGIDCGPVQRRVYEPYTFDATKRGFDAHYQIEASATLNRHLHDTFLPRTGVQKPTWLQYIDGVHQRAWRLAALNWNYPWAADRLSRGLSVPTSPAAWVPKVHFKDGAPVLSPWDWCQFYALGNPSHDTPGLVCGFVTAWTA